MSASPPALSSTTPVPRPGAGRIRWVPVLFGLAIIGACSTTVMGGSHTQVAVDAAWAAILGKWHFNATGLANEGLRKTGHFFGYGMLGLFFRNAWHGTIRTFAHMVRSRLMLSSASLGIASTFVVACLDEWHQRFLPGRNGCFRDVLLDTAGALFINAVFWTIRSRRTAARFHTATI